MSATLLSFPPSTLRAATTSATPLLDLGKGLLADRARHGRDLSRETFAALVREWCDDAPTPLHREAILATAIAGVPEAKVLGAMLSCPLPAASELVRWMRTLPIANPFDGSFVPLVRDALLERIASDASPALEEARRRGAHAILERTATANAAAALTALGDAVSLHRPRSRRSTWTLATDDDVRATEALVTDLAGVVAATHFRVAYEIAPSAVLLRRDGHRIVGVAFGLRIGDAPAAMREADPDVAAAALTLEQLRARHPDGAADAMLVRSVSRSSGVEDDDVFAHAAVLLAAADAPSVRWILSPSGSIDLHALVGAGEPEETATRVARHHYEQLVGEKTPTESRAPGTPWFERGLRAALLELRRPHRLAATELARATAGGAPALRASIERACDALAREPGYADSARVLRATYFGPMLKQHAIAAELGLPFGTYRHHLRRAIAELAMELASQDPPAHELARS